MGDGLLVGFGYVFMVAMGHAGRQGGSVSEFSVTNYELAVAVGCEVSACPVTTGLGMKLALSRERFASENASSREILTLTITLAQHGGGNNRKALGYLRFNNP